MPGITGRGTTFNLPNYHGMLIAITPEDTPFTTAIGGLTGGRQADATEFEWQSYDLRNADQATRVRLEGADAPTAEHRVRSNITNVVEVHQEAVDVSYTKLAAVHQYGGANVGGLDNPVLDEAAWQMVQQVKQTKRDVEYSFLRGVYQKPVDNTTPRRTRGLLAAIATNVVANAPAAALTETMLLDLMQQVWENGGLREAEAATVIVNAWQKRRLSKILITDKGYQEQTRNVGGVNLQTIETDFGRLNLMLNRHMPTDQLAVASLDVCAPRFLLVPEKGFLFVEPLAKTGASERSQLYGEIGLEYGSEREHGKITGLTTAP